MNWFERLTGFAEDDYDSTRARLAVDGERLRSLVNGASYGIGSFEMATLSDLRQRVAVGGGAAGAPTVRAIAGEARALHRAPECAGATIQVASQFNALEMVSPEITPEHGVARYEGDPTQGPACAIAAGAATIYRNYFVPVDDGFGQRADRQLDGLAGVREALAARLGLRPHRLWEMRNGYADGTLRGIKAVRQHLDEASEADRDLLRGRLALGWHRDVEVTDGTTGPRPRVSQMFCSAIPVAYSLVPPWVWRPLACLVLEASYEATMLAGVLNARAGGSNVVLLTSVGGGVFGNESDWIHAAMRRAIALARGHALDVRLVSHRTVAPDLAALAAEFGA